MKRTLAGTVAARDPGEAVALLAPLFGDVTVTPDPAESFDFELTTFAAEGMAGHTLVTSSGGTVSVARPCDGYLLVALRRGGLSVQTLHGKIERAEGSCLMLRCDEVLRWHWLPGTYEMLVIGASVLHRRLATLVDGPVSARIRFEPDVPPGSEVVPIARGIADLIARCIRMDRPLQGSEETIRCLRDGLVTMLLTNIPNSYSPRLGGYPRSIAPRHVRRAVAFIHAHAGEPLSVDHIAQAACVSVRSLQNGFVATKGVSPMAYVRQVRLAGARRDLLAARDGDSVATIARRWGFAHLGLFAKAYFRAFGELPSATWTSGRHGEGRDPQEFELSE